MLSELERIRQSAQLEMDQQQLEYQDKLQELSKEMVILDPLKRLAIKDKKVSMPKIALLAP